MGSFVFGVFTILGLERFGGGAGCWNWNWIWGLGRRRYGTGWLDDDDGLVVVV